MGRYTKSVTACNPSINLCRIAVLINVVDDFVGSKKCRNFMRRAEQQHVHVLWWQPSAEKDIEMYMGIIKAWQASYRLLVPFDQHVKAPIK